MIIEQETTQFEPITITFAFRTEAKAFFNLIDKVEDYRCNEDSEFTITNKEAEILMELSNAVTNKTVVF